jgi:hypothetical protein
VVTPFGTVYSTNLTPDPATGLGAWSFSAFQAASSGRWLYGNASAGSGVGCVTGGRDIR